MHNAVVLRVLMATCVLLVAQPVRAVDDPAEKFIGEIIADAKTNSAKAAKLLETAKVLTAQPKIYAAVLEKAVEFGVKSPATPEGCHAACDALDMLKAEFPDRNDEWTLKRIDVCTAAYRTAKTRTDKIPAGRELLVALIAGGAVHEKSGDWPLAATRYRQAVPIDAYIKGGQADTIQRKLKTAAHLATVAVRAAQYAASVKRDPAKTSTRVILVKLLVVELNDPKRAVEYLNEDMDEKWRTCVPLAAGDVGDLSEAACMDLGVWYHKELAKIASPAGKGVSLRRAKSYYKRFVELHTKADIQTARARTAMADVEKQIAALDAPPAIRLSGRGGKTFVLSMGRGVTMKLVRINAGKFLMGKRRATKARHKDEAPQHSVTIGKSFYIGVTEVTQAQYKFVTGKDPSKFKDPGNPVEQGSWDEAAAFCAALSKKTGVRVSLPTEAQWEYACRAGTTTDFSFGSENDALDAHGWYNDNGGQKTHKVALKKPSPAGLYDIHGNVWEWCRDWYESKFYARSKAVDPENVTQAKSRVIRGGSWKNASDGARSTSRDKESPDKRLSHIGFRIVIETR